MTDTRPKALEKAKARAAEQRAERERQETPSPLNAQPGEGFESERKRANQSLRRQMNSYDGQQVQRIAATEDTPNDKHVLRMAAYCRVSTNDIEDTAWGIYFGRRMRSQRKSSMRRRWSAQFRRRRR